jgi:hypothetical protein
VVRGTGVPRQLDLKLTVKFVVTDHIREEATAKGWPDPDREVEKFINYFEATGWRRRNGARIVNREAEFRNWLIKGVEMGRGRPIPGKPAVRPKQSPPKQRQPEMSEEQRRANLLRVRDLLKQSLKGMKDR